MIKKILIAIATSLLIYGCGEKKTESGTTETEEVEAVVESADVDASYDPNRGEGKYDASNVEIGALNKDMAAKGKAVSETKCFSCHKLTDEKLVGPGWKDVTTRRTPHWIMNFITNPDPMIDKDPEVQAQLELCLVRMPNQNLADEEARSIVEFMRENDGVK